MLCTFCGDTGVYHHEESYMTCPYCEEQTKFIFGLEVAIADLIIEGKSEEAIDLNIIYNLLKTAPVLAVLEAEHQNRSRSFIDKIQTVFEVKKLE